jgi:Recombination endonuclease VII
MKVPNADYLRLTFLLTQGEWIRVYEFQHGICPGCKTLLPDTCTLTDHDHRPPALFRGLLCFRCNKLLADWVTAERLENLVEYLKNPPATQALGHPHYGVPHRTGSKIQRKARKKLLANSILNIQKNIGVTK